MDRVSAVEQMQLVGPVHSTEPALATDCRGIALFTKPELEKAQIETLPLLVGHQGMADEIFLLFCHAVADQVVHGATLNKTVKGLGARLHGANELVPRKTGIGTEHCQHLTAVFWVVIAD